MTIQHVGGNTATKAGATSGNSTISLTTLTGGISSSAAAGDLVIAVFATGSAADRTLAITDGTTAYTVINSELYANGTTYDTNLRVAYKFLTGADASTTFGPTGHAQDAGAMAVHVWRGVDQSAFTTNTATGTGTGRPNAAAVTPTKAGAVVVVAGGAAAATGAVFTAAELSNFHTASAVDTNDAMVGVGSFAWTSGAYDPAQWTGGTTNAVDSWAAVTVVLNTKNYQLTCNNGSYAYTGQSATLLRSKAITASQGSYAYTGQSATITWATPPVGYSITAQHGVYAISGQGANLAHNRALVAQAGAYAATGQSIGLTKGRNLTAQHGTYGVSGQDAGLLRGNLITASHGSYAYSGQSAVITKASGGGYTLTCSAGSYVYGPYYVEPDYITDGYFGNAEITISPFVPRGHIRRRRRKIYQWMREEEQKQAETARDEAEKETIATIRLAIEAEMERRIRLDEQAAEIEHLMLSLKAAWAEEQFRAVIVGMIAKAKRQHHDMLKTIKEIEEVMDEEDLLTLIL